MANVSYLGYVLCVLALVGNTASTACAQALMGFIPDIQLNVSRFGSAVFLSALVLAFEQKQPTIEKLQVPGIVVTGICRVISKYGLYTGAALLPVGTLHGFYNGTMITVCTLVTVVTSRSCPLSASIPCLLCICGLVMTSQPPLLGFPSVTRTQVHNISFCYNSLSIFRHNRC